MRYEKVSCMEIRKPYLTTDMDDCCLKWQLDRARRESTKKGGEEMRTLNIYEEAAAKEAERDQQLSIRRAAGNVVDARTQIRMEKFKEDYKTAMKAVLDADPVLKENYIR